MGKSKAAPEKVTAAERRSKALELRKLGLTYKKIGDQRGITEAGAHKIVTTALQQLNEKSAESAAEVRRLELERLDEYQLVVARDFKSDRALGAVDRALRIQARRSKLLGLDAPVRLEFGEIQHEFSMALISAAKAGDPEAAEAVRRISAGKEDMLAAWFRWWDRARLPLACTPADVAKMTPEELALAAQGKLKQHQLEEIRARPADDGDAAED
jgi:hypothetical protein